MPNKKINHTIMKMSHSMDTNPITHHHQKHQDKKFIKEGKKGRGIHIGSLMDFNANTHYNEKKRHEEDDIKPQRKGDNVLSRLPAPKHLNEILSSHIFRCDCKRTDAKNVVQN